jgi:hypothetical protein
MFSLYSYHFQIFYFWFIFLGLSCMRKPKTNQDEKNTGISINNPFHS